MNEQHPLPSLSEAPSHTPQSIVDALSAAPTERVSKELVPQDYGRFAYNALHGTALEAHKDHLTAEQARRINENFDIEVYLGTHGFALDPNDPYSRLGGLPTQEEYDAAADAVNGLEQGDVLLVEGVGFMESEVQSVPQLHEQDLSTSVAANPAFEYLAHLVLQLADQSIELQRKDLEERRRNYGLDAFSYAIELARLKGVEILYADHDAFEVAANHAVLGKNALDLMAGTPEERAKAPVVHASRERKARNTVKDVGLKRLPVAEQRVEPVRKPILRLLFGRGHKDGLEQGFNEMGLDARFVVMGAREADRKRARKHRGYVLDQELAELASGVPSLVELATSQSHDSFGRFNAFRKKMLTEKDRGLGKGGLDWRHKRPRLPRQNPED